MRAYGIAPEDALRAANAKFERRFRAMEALASGADVPYIGPSGLAPYDLVLSFTGGGALDALAGRLGARRVAPLYGSVDLAVHHRVPPRAEYVADLSYLGTYAEDRQPALERLFLEPAARLPGSRFVVGGSLYPSDFPWAPNIWYRRHVAPPDHAAFYKRFFAFEQIGEPRSYPTVKNNPVVPLRMDLQKVKSLDPLPKGLRYFAENELPARVFANRYNFDEGQVASSPIAQFLNYKKGAVRAA